MTNGKDIRAGGGYVEITTRDKGFTEGLRQSLRQASQWAKKMAAVGGGVGVAAGAGLFGIGNAFDAIRGAISGLSIQGFAKQFAEFGASIQDVSERTGIAASDLTAFQHIADLSDFTLDDLQKGVLKLGQNLEAAATGSATAQAGFDKLGLSWKALAGQNQLQRFESVIDALGRIDDPALRAAAALELFGKGGVAFLPLIKAGAGAVADMRKEAEALGLVFTDEQIQRAADFDDLFVKLRATIAGVGRNFGAALAENFSKLLTTGIKIAGTVNHIIRRNEKLIGSLVPIAAGALAVGTAFAAVAGSVAFIGPMIPAIALVGAKLTALTAAAVFLGSNWREMADVGRAAFQYVANVSQWALDNMGDNFREFFRFGLNGFQTFANGAKSWIGAIANAIAAGDISAAFDLVQETMKAGWTITTQTMLAGWKATTLNMELLGLESFYGIMEGWELVKKAFGEGFNFIRKGWQNIFGITEDYLKRKGLDDASQFVRFMADANQAAIDGADATTANSSALDAIRQQRDEARNANNEQFNNVGNEPMKEIDAAKDRLAKARERAANAQGVDLKNKGLNLGGFDASAFEAKELNTGRTSAAMGTFSAAAAGQLGAGSYDQEQVNLLGMIHDQLRFIALRGGIQ